MALVEYTLKRSRRRKTVAIKVHQQSVTVYAPYDLAKHYIEQWLESKQQWVQAQIIKQSEQIDARQFPLQSLQIKLFAVPLAINFRDSKATSWQFINESAQRQLQITTSGRVKNKVAMYQAQIDDFMRNQLESYIEMRLQTYCTQMAEALPSKLKIAIYKRRWGSCNQRRELTFNLLLASAPQWVIDYVIVHELVHLKYLNHSKQFWQRVSEFYPEYKQATQWLKHHGASLQWVVE